MKKMWNVINGMNIDKAAKSKLYIVAWTFVNIVIGGVMWLTWGRMLLPGIDWLLCFTGYPAIFIGLFGGGFYLYKHEFEKTAQ